MARGTYRKLLTVLPDDYTSDFVDKIDKRTKVARALLDRIQVIESDLGGSETLAHTRRSLVRRAVFLEALVESQELKLAAGQPIDVGAYTQGINSMLGVYRLLGLERRQRPVRSLRDHLNGTAKAVSA
jgi:hypothetical protein